MSPPCPASRPGRTRNGWQGSSTRCDGSTGRATSVVRHDVRIGPDLLPRRRGPAATAHRACWWWLPLALAVASAAACARRPQHPSVVYFNPEPPLTLRLPSNWTTDQVEQEGTSYRYFLAPRVGTARKPAVSTALLVEPSGDLDQIAQRYVAGQNVSSTRDAGREGRAGKAWRFTSADGATRHSL